MGGACQNIDGINLVQGLLGSVDCNVQTLSEVGYHVLTGPGSQVTLALTSLMTIYVAILGFRLLMGLAPLRVGDLTMMALKLALVLTFATSWPTYQHVVFDTLFHGPEQLFGGLLSAGQADGSPMVGNPFNRLQFAYDQMQAAAAFFARISPPASSPLFGGVPFAAFSLNGASWLMMLSTLGVVLATKIVLALLLALGPVFIALLLFEQTRGVFEGWLRACLALALMPLLATFGLVVQLILVEPQLARLAAMLGTGEPDLAAATATFLLTSVAAGVSLIGLLGVVVIALGFKLPRPRSAPVADRSPAGVLNTTSNRKAAEPAAVLMTSQPRVAATTAAVVSMERRDARQAESPRAASRSSFTPRAANTPDMTLHAAPLGRTYRRSASPLRAASSARRDR